MLNRAAVSEVQFAQDKNVTKTSDHGFDSILYLEDAQKKICNGAHVGKGYILISHTCYNRFDLKSKLKVGVSGKSLFDLNPTDYQTQVQTQAKIALIDITDQAKRKKITKLSTFAINGYRLSPNDAFFVAGYDPLEPSRTIDVVPSDIKKGDLDTLEAKLKKSPKGNLNDQAPLLFRISSLGAFELFGLFSRALTNDLFAFSRVTTPMSIEWIKSKTNLDFYSIDPAASQQGATASIESSTNDDGVTLTPASGSAANKESTEADETQPVAGEEVVFYCQSDLPGYKGKKITVEIEDKKMVSVSFPSLRAQSFKTSYKKPTIDSMFFELGGVYTGLLRYEDTPPTLKLVHRKKNTLEKLTCLRGS